MLGVVVVQGANDPPETFSFLASRPEEVRSLPPCLFFFPFLSSCLPSFLSSFLFFPLRPFPRFTFLSFPLSFFPSFPPNFFSPEFAFLSFLPFFLSPSCLFSSFYLHSSIALSSFPSFLLSSFPTQRASFFPFFLSPSFLPLSLPPSVFLSFSPTFFPTQRLFLSLSFLPSFSPIFFPTQRLSFFLFLSFLLTHFLSYPTTFFLSFPSFLPSFLPSFSPTVFPSAMLALLLGRAWAGPGLCLLLRAGLSRGARPLAKRFCSPAGEPFPLDGFVSRDVVLFQHERPRFFRSLGLFCLGQFAFWLYLADLAFTTLREAPAREAGAGTPQPPPARPWLGNLFGSAKWRYGFSASCVAVGTLILAAGFFFARRSVSRILLLRGSQEVTFTTYYLFGYTSSFTVPLRHVCCMNHRSEVAAIIPVKIRGKPFYFLLDKQGSITSNPLFDITVGAYREW